MNEFIRYAKKCLIVSSVIVLVSSVVLYFVLPEQPIFAEAVIFGGIAGGIIFLWRVMDIRRMALLPEPPTAAQAAAYGLKSQIRTVLLRLLPVGVILLLHGSSSVLAFVVAVVATTLPDAVLYVDAMIHPASSRSEGNSDA